MVRWTQKIDTVGWRGCWINKHITGLFLNAPSFLWGHSCDSYYSCPFTNDFSILLLAEKKGSISYTTLYCCLSLYCQNCNPTVAQKESSLNAHSGFFLSIYWVLGLVLETRRGAQTSVWSWNKNLWSLVSKGPNWGGSPQLRGVLYPSAGSPHGRPRLAGEAAHHIWGSGKHCR